MPELRARLQIQSYVKAAGKFLIHAAVPVPFEKPIPGILSSLKDVLYRKQSPEVLIQEFPEDKHMLQNVAFQVSLGEVVRDMTSEIKWDPERGWWLEFTVNLNS